MGVAKSSATMAAWQSSRAFKGRPGPGLLPSGNLEPLKVKQYPATIHGPGILRTMRGAMRQIEDEPTQGLNQPFFMSTRFDLSRLCNQFALKHIHLVFDITHRHAFMGRAGRELGLSIGAQIGVVS
jgi:hypothetical protein